MGNNSTRRAISGIGRAREFKFSECYNKWKQDTVRSAANSIETRAISSTSGADFELQDSAGDVDQDFGKPCEFQRSLRLRRGRVRTGSELREAKAELDELFPHQNQVLIELKQSFFVFASRKKPFRANEQRICINRVSLTVH